MTKAKGPQPLKGLDLGKLDNFAGYLDKKQPESGLKVVRRDLIDPDPDQPRKQIDAAKLQELADSIAVHGVIQPIVVRPPVDGRYMIVSGERRWRAAGIVGLAEVEVVIKEKLNRRAQVVENLQREDLVLFDLFVEITAELEEGAKQAELARDYGMSRAWINNFASIAKMPPVLLKAFKDGRAGDVYALNDLSRLYGTAPDAVESWLNENQQITRTGVQLLAGVLKPKPETKKHAPAPVVPPDSEVGRNAAPESDVQSTAVRQGKELESKPEARTEDRGEPSGREDTDPHVAKSHQRRASSLPVDIQVQFQGAAFRVLYDQQRKFDNAIHVKLESASGELIDAPLDELRLVSIGPA